MATLNERLEELMKDMGWSHADLMRESRQSSSVVSQWLGKGSKEIKTIGKLEAAIYLERASGFSALWLAKGIGPKRAERAEGAALVSAGTVQEPPARYANAGQVLDQLAALLRTVPPEHRAGFSDVLAGWAASGGTDPSRRETLLTLLVSGKHARTA